MFFSNSLGNKQTNKQTKENHDDSLDRSLAFLRSSSAGRVVNNGDGEAEYPGKFYARGRGTPG